MQVSCVIARQNTELPATVEVSTNDMVSPDPGVIAERVGAVVANGERSGQVSALWKGRATGSIVDVLEERVVQRREQASGDRRTPGTPGDGL